MSPSEGRTIAMTSNRISLYCLSYKNILAASVTLRILLVEIDSSGIPCFNEILVLISKKTKQLSFFVMMSISLWPAVQLVAMIS